jgi:hypothetical protein
MAEEQVIKLLEEIRDLQKLHVENYKDALKNSRNRSKSRNGPCAARR